MEHEITKRLRATCEWIGIRYTKGLLLEGKRVDEDRFTTLWPDDDPKHTLTFEEVDGMLACDDAMEVDQCVAAAMVGSKPDTVRDHERSVVIERLGKLDLNSLDSHHNLAEIANAIWGSAPVAWTKESCSLLAKRIAWLLGTGK